MVVIILRLKKSDNDRSLVLALRQADDQSVQSV